MAANMQLSGIAAQPLLKDAAGIDWLAGTGNVTLALSGRGASETAIVQSLNGKSDVAVRNGAIIGFNLGGAMRALSQGNVPDFRSSPEEKTDFSELTGSFYDKAVALSLHDNVMSVGDTIDPADGFRAFRGRDVDTSALLRKRGFPVD